MAEVVVVDVMSGASGWLGTEAAVAHSVSSLQSDSPMVFTACLHSRDACNKSLLELS